MGGESLVFRMETDLPVDPDSVRWLMEGEMSAVCAPDGCCAAPRREDRERLRFVADTYLPLHESLADVPLRPFVVPRDGILHVSSVGLEGSPAPVLHRAHAQCAAPQAPRGRERLHLLPGPPGRADPLPGAQRGRGRASRIGASAWSWRWPRGMAAPSACRCPCRVTSPTSVSCLRRGEEARPSAVASMVGVTACGAGATRSRRARRRLRGRRGALRLERSSTRTWSWIWAGGSDRDKFRRGKVELRDEESDIARHTRLFAPHGAPPPRHPAHGGLRRAQARPGLREPGRHQLRHARAACTAATGASWPPGRTAPCAPRMPPSASVTPRAPAPPPASPPASGPRWAAARSRST